MYSHKKLFIYEIIIMVLLILSVIFSKSQILNIFTMIILIPLYSTIIYCFEIFNDTDSRDYDYQAMTALFTFPMIIAGMPLYMAVVEFSNMQINDYTEIENQNRISIFDFFIKSVGILSLFIIVIYAFMYFNIHPDIDGFNG